MIINKAHWTVTGDELRLSMPFGKIDKERRIVSGFASLDNLDKQMDIVTTEASMTAFAKFRGNVREMHQPSAVGKMVSFKEEKYFDPKTKTFYKGVYVSTYISKGAQDAWEKVLDGTYTGFSIGGKMNKWDDAFDEKLDAQIRIIKEYDLIELSLVDSPANQFANIMSVEKVDGIDIFKGSAIDTQIENVFWDEDSGIVLVSEEETKESPTTGNQMKNIGFVEKDDATKTDMIKFLVDSAKGIKTIKITKEDNPMTKDTEAVADVIETPVVAEIEKSEVTPEAQPEVIAEATVDVVTEITKDDSATSSLEDATQNVEPASPEAEKSDKVIVDSITEIKDSVTNAFGDIAIALKSLSDEVATLKKSLAEVLSDVNQVKGNFDEFGKRVDAVEHDTAFRKSGDLGEIVQESPTVIRKSLWGGRFLTNSDLFN